MRRFTCTEGGASKFWEAGIKGAKLSVRFGKLGTDGQTKDKSFPDAAAAERELAKLIKEKLGKGYVEDGKAGKSAARSVAAKAAPEKSTTAKSTDPKLGPFFAALLDKLRAGKKRKKPHEDAAPLLANKKLAADLRLFLEAINQHQVSYVAVGEFWLEETGIGQRVPKPDDDDQDRDDVLAIGNSPGGDPWVVDIDATGKRAWITRIVHDDGWTEGEAHEGFEEFLEQMTRDSWEKNDETHLDEALAARGITRG